MWPFDSNEPERTPDNDPCTRPKEPAHSDAPSLEEFLHAIETMPIPGEAYQPWPTVSAAAALYRVNSATHAPLHGQPVVFKMCAGDGTEKGGMIRSFNALEFDSPEAQIRHEYHEWFQNGGTLAGFGAIHEGENPNK
jgi:hypothetical protein